MKVGALAIEPVYDGAGYVPGRKVLTIPGRPDPWEKCGHYLDGDGNLRLTFGGFLLRSGGRVALIDAGLGEFDEDGWSGGQFLDSLRGLGVASADVTDVVFTHLHWDHIGWASRNGEIVFPNATYRVHEADWAHFMEGPETDPIIAGPLIPVTERVKTFDRETTLLPGLDARPVPGHTPGSTIYVVSSEDERALLTGDVLHSPAQVTDSAWECVWDLDSAAARRVRAELTAAAADGPDVIAAAHFPFGHVITVDGEHRFRFLRDAERAGTGPQPR
jgi:glyoxylase-like metal-dependent hydrolase (beta-lactamase superfamily II)